MIIRAHSNQPDLLQEVSRCNRQRKELLMIRIFGNIHELQIKVSNFILTLCNLSN